LATINVEVPPNASGVLYCVGGNAGGLTVYLDRGHLYSEYKATLLYRYEAKSANSLTPSENKIEVRLQYEPEKVDIPAANLTLHVNDEQVGTVRVEKSIRHVFDPSESFDVGMDLGSPVARRYEDRVPFKYSGKITSLKIKYINACSPSEPEQAI